MTGPDDRSDALEVRISPVGLDGVLGLPRPAAGLVPFAHGSGSGRFSPRNNTWPLRSGGPAWQRCCSTC
jgi:hypothetical protein